MKLKFEIGGLSYGDNKITEMLRLGNFGFELSIKDENYLFRKILTLEESQELEKQMKNAFSEYKKSILEFQKFKK